MSEARRILAFLFCLGLGTSGWVTSASAQEDDVGKQLATLPDTFGKSIVTVVKETEVKMGGLGAMFGGGDGETTKSRVVGVVVGENLIMTPKIAAEGPGGMLGGMLEQFAGQITMETKDLGTKVIAYDGEEYEAELIGDDDVIGVAFWKIVVADSGTMPELVAVTFPAAPRLALGDRVIGLAPLGLGFTRNVAGISSRVNAVKEKPVRFYDTETLIGGPGSLVVNLQGAPVGIILPNVDLAGAEGLGDMFESLLGASAPIYPADHFNALIANPPQKAKEGQTDGVQKPWLGISMQAVPATLAEALGLKQTGGISVTKVYRGFSADAAGLMVEDILLGVDELTFEKVQTASDLDVMRDYIARKKVGDIVNVDYWRDGEVKVLPLTLTAKPIENDDAPNVEDKDFELTVRELTFWDRQDRNLADDVKGVVVKKIERAGWAGIGDVKKGDIILKVGDLVVDSIDSFKSAVEAVKQAKPKTIVFYVQQGLDTRFLEIEPNWERGKSREF